jgi:hypothetical protein
VAVVVVVQSDLLALQLLDQESAELVEQVAVEKELTKEQA